MRDQTTELGEIAREVTLLRRKILVVHGAIAIGGATVLARTLRGVGGTERSRFLAAWAAVFVTSLLALGSSAQMRARLHVMFARARGITLPTARASDGRSSGTSGQR